METPLYQQAENQTIAEHKHKAITNILILDTKTFLVKISLGLIVFFNIFCRKDLTEKNLQKNNLILSTDFEIQIFEVGDISRRI